ncbi:MAG: phosphotransferase [Eubacteriales bacterium]|nr:phosphotransferase [Eubacteriales bacterium]MDD3882428.1 phosphotransferase [Eubacteriales bacterium]MDD4513808.1 phosphotransferase [Eubacteriales bacterium]
MSEEERLKELLYAQYGIARAELRLMRDWVNRVYKAASGKEKYLLKIIGEAFSASAETSLRVNDYLYDSGVFVPRIIRTLSGFLCYSEGGKHYVLYTFVDGRDTNAGEDTEAID